jgi:hypothetical protein
MSGHVMSCHLSLSEVQLDRGTGLSGLAVVPKSVDPRAVSELGYVWLD